MDDQQLLRYSRHILLPDIDVEGQQKLLDGKVLIVGLGGLGSPVAMYLAAAGVGELLLADFDEVEVSNLQRQVIHTTARLGQSKVASAAEALQELNPGVRVKAIDQRLDSAALQKYVSDVDVVVDCSDNFTTRTAINRSCIIHRKPLVSGAAIGFEGQLAVFDLRDRQNPCYHCLYGELEEESLSCSESGVVAPLVGVMGSFQALETVKLLVGLPSSQRLLLFSAKESRWREMNIQKDPECPLCSQS